MIQWTSPTHSYVVEGTINVNTTSTAVATIGTSAVLSEVDWVAVLSASILTGILSLLTSLATNLPEVEV